MNASEVAYLLQERVKELECHNQLSLLLSQGNLEMDVLLDKTVGLIEQAFQFPAYTLVKIVLRGYASQSVHYVETPYKLAQRILIDEQPVGEIVVCYAEGFPKPEDPFFEEEKKLLLTVALRLGKYLDKLEKDAALQKSENLYRSILRSSPDSVTITDLDGTIRIASPSAHMLMGTDPDGENLIGRNIFEVILPEDRSKALEAVQSIASKNVREPSEYRVRKLDGSILEVEANADFIRDEKGVPVQMIVITRNVTDRNQAARKLLESQNAFKEMVETINDVIFEVNMNGIIHYLSPAIERMLGYSPDELLGKNFFHYMHPEDIDALKEAFSHLGKKDYSYLEYRYFNKAGQPYWVRSSTKALYENGVLVGGRGVIVDINDKKEKDEALNRLNSNLEKLVAERTEELAESNRKLLQEMDIRNQTDEALRIKTDELEKFFTVSLDLLCIADVDGRFIRVNNSWEELLGYTSKELEGRPFLDFVHPDDLEATLHELTTLSEQKKVLYFTNRYRAKEGQYRYIEWYSVPEGNYIYAAAHDVTERKKAEDFENELLQLSAMLTGLPLLEIDSALQLSLQRIGTFLEADRSYIFEIDETGDTMSNTFEWCNQGIASEIDNLRHVSCSLVPRFMEELHQSKVIEIPLLSALPEDWSLERAMLEPQGIQSLIVIPLFVETKLMGFVGLDSVRQTKTYSSSEVNTLRVWGSMLASLINRKVSESLLEQSRANVETFFSSIDDFLWVSDTNRKIMYVNNAVQRLLGYTHEELVGNQVKILFQADNFDTVVRESLEMLEGKRLYMNTSLRRKDGRSVPVESKLKRGFWNGVPALFGVSKDITDIQISERKFSTAFHSNPTMMAISRMRDGVYLDVNNTFTETLGYSTDELIGHSDKELHLIVDPTIKDHIIDQVRRGEIVRKMEMQMQTKSGEIRTGLLSADAILVGDEQCVITVNVDITERKKAEVELQLARQEAERANLAKSEFLSRMSHELRTPMNSILGFAQLLEMGELNNTQRKGVSHILHSGKHLLDLINEVLDISRIEAGRLSLSLEPIDVEKLVQETLDIIHPLAVNNQVELRWLSQPLEPLFVLSDHQRLKQILLNLLNNAVKYNRAGGSATVRAERVQHPGQPTLVRITVSDTGIGIHPDNLPKIFDAFERIGAEKSEQEGTGLGLAVVKKLVDVLKGRIGVESQPGNGSTFWLEFEQAVSPNERLHQTTIDETTNNQLNGLRGTLLYVEDNGSNIDLVEEILALQHAGIKLVTTKFGGEAQALAAQCKPNLILLDLNLPDLPGEEVLRIFQQHSETRDIPVVVISADAMPKQTDRLLRAGARKFLTKPIDITEFLEVLVDYFEK